MYKANVSKYKANNKQTYSKSTAHIKQLQSKYRLHRILEYDKCKQNQ